MNETKPTHRRFRRFAALAAIALAATGVAAAPGNAAKFIAMDGVHGRASVDEPGATCYFPAGLNGIRYLITHPPRMYATDATTGRDWSWVRYRPRIVNYWTGVTTSVRPWSEWQVAYDDTAAPFASYDWAPLQANNSVNDYTQWAGNSVVQVEMEWWTQTSRTGGAILQAGAYRMLFNPVAPAGYMQNGINTTC
jgi:hypothetical protein